VVCNKKTKNILNLFYYFFKDNGMSETGLSDLPIEVLHSLLLLIQKYILNESKTLFIKTEDFENFLNLLRKG
jgi:hypothetical protein